MESVGAPVGPGAMSGNMKPVGPENKNKNERAAEDVLPNFAHESATQIIKSLGVVLATAL